MKWRCSCGVTGVKYDSETKQADIYGDAFLYGQPHEAVACRQCGDRWTFIKLNWTNKRLKKKAAA